MKIVRRIIRKRLCRPILIIGILSVGLYATSDKWIPYVKDQLQQETDQARNIIGQDKSNARKSTDAATVEKSENEAKEGRQKKKSLENSSGTKGKNSAKGEAKSGEKKEYRDTAADIKKTVNDTKNAAGKVKNYLDEFKTRGDPIIDKNMPDAEIKTPEVIQDGLDTVNGIRERVWDFIKGASEKVREAAE